MSYILSSKTSDMKTADLAGIDKLPNMVQQGSFLAADVEDCYSGLERIHIILAPPPTVLGGNASVSGLSVFGFDDGSKHL